MLENTSNVENKSQASGIPRGNTVAIVGDPGTGKTTFLLTYVAHGCVQFVHEKDNKLQQVVLSNGQETDEQETFKAIDSLFAPAGFKINKGSEAKSDEANDIGTLRCFISLENNLTRLLKNHSHLLNILSSNPNDRFVVIDATAFLSGRLEDRLRYPRLTGVDSEPELPKPWKDYCYDFNLGGHDIEDGEHFGLYHQDENEEPTRIEQLLGDRRPFPATDEANHQAYNIITQPIPDPFQRVRLIKDLLAEIFVRYKKCQHRILAIDSLSALMNPIDAPELTLNTSTDRRLNMLNLVRWLEEYGVTTFLACEAEHEPNRTFGGSPLFLGTEERYLSSGVIQLNYHAYKSGDIVRYLRVLKMRGAAHDMRPHAYDLGLKGISWLEPLFGEAGAPQ